MDSDQYEEFCRHFVAQEVGVSIDDVKSVSILNPKRTELPEYSHQIDLYWETSDPIALYLNIANAKWRGTGKVDQGDVLLLQQVRLKVAAHKAFMITNVGFSAGAIAAAKDEGIALHVVAPSFDTSDMPQRDRGAMRTYLQQVSASAQRPVYLHTIANRGLGLPAGTASQGAAPSIHSRPAPAVQTRIATPSAPQSAGPSLSRPLGGGGVRGGAGPGTSNRGGGGFPRG
jgi:hypothetical protein